MISLAATLGASCAGLVMGASASAAPADVAATHSYIKANYAFARASVARIHAAHAKIAVFEARLARECPNVGKGSPENDASQPKLVDIQTENFGTRKPASENLGSVLDSTNSDISRSRKTF